MRLGLPAIAGRTSSVDPTQMFVEARIERVLTPIETAHDDSWVGRRSAIESRIPLLASDLERTSWTLFLLSAKRR